MDGDGFLQRADGGNKVLRVLDPTVMADRFGNRVIVEVFVIVVVKGLKVAELTEVFYDRRTRILAKLFALVVAPLAAPVHLGIMFALKRNELTEGGLQLGDWRGSACGQASVG